MNNSVTVLAYAGVLNVVSGDSKSIGEALVSSNTVRKIGFTGSTKVGKYLMERSASTVKKVSMELGGNAPFIVFADADLEAAAKAVVMSGLRNAGQVCIAANRVMVHVRSRARPHAANMQVLVLLPSPSHFPEFTASSAWVGRIIKVALTPF